MAETWKGCKHMGALRRDPRATSRSPKTHYCETCWVLMGPEQDAVRSEGFRELQARQNACAHTWRHGFRGVWCDECGKTGTTKHYADQEAAKEAAYTSATFDEAVNRLVRAARSVNKSAHNPILDAALDDLDAWMENAMQDETMRRAALGSDGRP